MKRRYLAFLLALAPALLLVGSPASASTFGPDELSVKVPFQFVVGETVLPAGRYDVRATDIDPEVMWLVSPNGHHVAVMVTEWGGAAFEGRKPDLRFKVYGNTHFLSQVQIPGEGVRLVPLTRNEVQDELARLAEEGATRG